MGTATLRNWIAPGELNECVNSIASVALGQFIVH